jgi:4-hydroxy-3-polyprenylbenzoate decarboxylase
MKVVSSLFGAGQMMFTKYLVVVSGDINIRNYKELLVHVFAHVDFSVDLLFIHGPLDVLDHSSDTFSFGGKVGVDATIKHIEECTGRINTEQDNNLAVFNNINSFFDKHLIKNFNLNLLNDNIPILIISVNRSENVDVIEKINDLFKINDPGGFFRLILAVDHTVDPGDLYMVVWQVLGNTDPQRDHKFNSTSSVLIDGTIKAYRKGGFPRRWPNVVCSNIETISAIDQKWESLGIGSLIQSPSIKNLGLCRKGTDEILINEV